MSVPALRVTSVTISAPDPRTLAAFYARLLDQPVTTTEPARPGHPPQDGWAQLRTSGPTLNFEYDAEYVPPVWPSAEGRQQTQTHLDIAVEDLEAAAGWAETCGATQAEFQPQDDVRVMLDPAGHPFCLFLSA